MEMNNKNRSNLQRLLIVVIVILGVTCLCLSVFVQGLAQGDATESLPISIQVREFADYSADQRISKPNISLNIIEDIFRDEAPEGEDISERVNQALAQLDTPVPTVTPIHSFTPSNTPSPAPTSTGTRRPTWTPIPSATYLPTRTLTLTSTAVLPSLTATAIPSATFTSQPTSTAVPTNTSVPSSPPPPSNTPTPTNTATIPQPTLTSTATSIPTDTPLPTETYTPQPTPTEAEVINIEIIIPTEGQTITRRNQTRFEAEAWVGGDRINGKDIERVVFVIEALGHMESEESVRFCAFAGDDSCNRMSSSQWDSLDDGTYSIRAQACSEITGDCTGWVTKTFVIEK